MRPQDGQYPTRTHLLPLWSVSVHRVRKGSRSQGHAGATVSGTSLTPQFGKTSLVGLGATHGGHNVEDAHQRCAGGRCAVRTRYWSGDSAGVASAAWGTLARSSPCKTKAYGVRYWIIANNRGAALGLTREP